MQLRKLSPSVTEHTGRQRDRKATKVANTGYLTNPSNPFRYCLCFKYRNSSEKSCKNIGSETVYGISSV